MLYMSFYNFPIATVLSSIQKLCAIAVLLVLLGCAREEALPVTVDFGIDVFNDDYSIPVQVVIQNRTKGAETYAWEFVGGIPAMSTERNPGVIRYEKKGNYTIRLYATNADGSEGAKEIPIRIDDPVVIDFAVAPLVNLFPPVTLDIDNRTTGATDFVWTFEQGVPATTTAQHPAAVVLNTPGTHRITLEASNGLETERIEKTITVAPRLLTDFELAVAFEDDDYQVPVAVTLRSTSVSATAFDWQMTNGVPATADTPELSVTFTTPGKYTIALTATNAKETQTVTKTIEVFEDTNLRKFEGIRLGINSAHTANTTGAFFATNTRRVYTAAELTPEIAPQIDLVFFGLNQNFIRNRFVAPDALDTTTFPLLAGATHTKFINSQEACMCTASLTAAQFDAMEDDRLLQTLAIEETPEGLQEFDATLVPRIVLFETADGRKGAIKIKEYIPNGQDSAILVDIKIQKRKTK